MIIISPAPMVQEAIHTYSPGGALAFTDAGADISAVPSGHYLNLPMDMTCTDKVESVLTEMIDFAKNHDWQKSLLITCKLGMSRSPAAAFIIASAMAPTLDEIEIAKALRAASPCADPHLMLIAAADEMLDRDGLLMDALDYMGAPRGECMGQIAALPLGT